MAELKLGYSMLACSTLAKAELFEERQQFFDGLSTSIIPLSLRQHPPLHDISAEMFKCLRWG